MGFPGLGALFVNEGFTGAVCTGGDVGAGSAHTVGGLDVGVGERFQSDCASLLNYRKNFGMLVMVLFLSCHTFVESLHVISTCARLKLLGTYWLDSTWKQILSRKKGNFQGN